MLLGVLSSAGGPFLEPLGIVRTPPPPSPQGWIAAGNCAVVWFLQYRHGTCTWRQFFLHTLFACTSQTVFDVISLYSHCKHVILCNHQRVTKREWVGFQRERERDKKKCVTGNSKQDKKTVHLLQTVVFNTSRENLLSDFRPRTILCQLTNQACVTEPGSESFVGSTSRRSSGSSSSWVLWVTCWWFGSTPLCATAWKQWPMCTC